MGLGQRSPIFIFTIPSGAQLLVMWDVSVGQPRLCSLRTPQLVEQGPGELAEEMGWPSRRPDVSEMRLQMLSQLC